MGSCAHCEHQPSGSQGAQRMQRFLRHCTEKVLDAVNIGSVELVNLGQNEYSTEFVLLGLLEQDDSIVLRLLAEADPDADRLKEQILDRIYAAQESKPKLHKPTPTQIMLTKEMDDLFRRAKEEADALGDRFIGAEALFLAMFTPESGVVQEILDGVGLRYERIKEAVRRLRQGRHIEDKKSEEKFSILDQYTIDLTEKARKGELDPVIGREREIKRVIQILSRRKKNNPVLIGEPGVGKSVIVEGLAQQIAAAEVPESLVNKTLLQLSMADVVAGSKFRGEFEERLKLIKQEIINASGQIILFIDELHTVAGAGAVEGGLDASNMLKPALASGQLQCIGATTLDDYRKHIEKDKALERRFQTVMVGEPTTADTYQILQGLRPHYEAHHEITYSDVALRAAASLSERYITDRFLPDKAIDLIDEAGARKHLDLIYLPPELRQLKKQKESLLQKQSQAYRDEDYEAAARFRQQVLQVDKELKEKTQEWRRAFTTTDTEVTEEEIAQVVASWTNIPVMRMLESEAEKLKKMEENLHRRIIGQDQAIGAISDAIRRNRAGLKPKNRPIGSFLFLGPTGVGKTEVAKALAEFLFDDEERLVRVDMSEYMERHTVSRLIGSPPGYVGYGEGGQLTEKVRRNPYSIVLFDEIEKAHPDVFNMLLQILDDGRLTDGQGRTVSFKNTVIIGTSNLGSSVIVRDTVEIGFGRAPSAAAAYAEIRKRVLQEVRKNFKPEFLNRIDDLIVFHRLDEGHIRSIVDLMFRQLNERLREHQLSLAVTSAVKDLLVREGFDPAYGARPMRRTIESLIENPLAMRIISGDFPEGAVITADLRDGEVVFHAEAAAAVATGAPDAAGEGG
ncbi:MAG: AAA family ATPase [Candidatus Tectomicrobia bacterium]|nr:AAA family ATPase [Candidatus Tectomicrobia bacterium]